jgi:thiosulfate dehydrogenase (quinone) large subunit
MTTSTPHAGTARLGRPTTGGDGAPGLRARESTVGTVALVGLRLAIGFEFLWAFLDKLFGWGYATPAARAWVNGGSPTRGFLSGVTSGPLKGVFNGLAGVAGMDWLFMAGLLGIGTALLLGVALRPAAASGVLLLTLMWFATWPPATLADGVPTHSTNPLVDAHVVLAVLAGRSAGPLGRRWSQLPIVREQPWLR